MPWKKAGNRTGRSEGPPNRETEDDYSAFMQAISLSTSSSSDRKRIIRVYIVYTYDNKTGEILEHKYPINRLCNDSIIEHI